MRKPSPCERHVKQASVLVCQLLRDHLSTALVEAPHVQGALPMLVHHVNDVFSPVRDAAVKEDDVGLQTLRFVDGQI